MIQTDGTAWMVEPLGSTILCRHVIQSLRIQLDVPDHSCLERTTVISPWFEENSRHVVIGAHGNTQL